MPCPRKDEEMAELYLTGRLSESERESFERHLFECPECADDLETLETIRAGLLRAQPAKGLGRSPRRRLLKPMLAAAAALAAVAVGLWIIRRTPTKEVAGAPPVSRAGPPVVEPPSPPDGRPPGSPSRSNELVALARIRAPDYEPAVLRGPADDLEAAFREAMEPYRRGDYDTTISELLPVVESAPDDPRPRFYLGASYLLVGRNDEGLSTLERVVALGDTPFLEDARLLSAKARIRKGDLARADVELRAVILLRGDREEESRRLLDAVTAANGKP